MSPLPASYRSLFAAPGIRRLVVAALLGRLPVGVISLGLVLFVHSRYGGFGRAGATAAAYAIAQGAVAPVLGRFVDRFGQVRTLVIGGPLSALALAGGVLAGLNRSPVLVVAGLAAISGAARPPLSACLRRMLSALLGDGPALDSAYALESVLVEVIYVSGPLITTGLAAAGSPGLALLLAAAMTLVGTLGFVTAPQTRAWRPEPGRRARAGALGAAGMRTLIAATLIGGVGLGALEVALPAFASHHGSAAAGGLALTAMALTSLTAGLWYGAHRFTGSLRRRYLILTALSALVLVPPLLAGSVVEIVVVMALAGVVQAPLGACTYTLIDRLTPPGTLTEAFTWLTASTVGGAAIGNALAGVLAAPGPRYGLGVAAASGLIALLVAGARRATLGAPA